MKQYAAVLLVDHNEANDGEEIVVMLGDAPGILGSRYIEQMTPTQCSVAVIYESREDPRRGLEDAMDGVDQVWIDGWDTAPDTKILQLDARHGLDVESALDEAEAQLDGLVHEDEDEENEVA